MEETIKEVVDFLESWDCEPTKENITRTLKKWIENLYSHIGAEAHMHSLACGVVDETGVSWEDQDMQMLQQIKKYKQCIMEVELYEK